MNKKYILGLILLAVIVLLALASCLFSRNKVILKLCERQDGSIDFLFDYKNVNGLLDMRVWEGDSRTLLWNVKLSYFEENILKYGEVPSEFVTFNRVHNSAQQVYPWNNNSPKALPLDKEIYVCLKYQYDDFMTPCAAYSFYVIKVKPELFVEKIDRIPADKWYQEPIKDESVE